MNYYIMMVKWVMKEWTFFDFRTTFSTSFITKKTKGDLPHLDKSIISMWYIVEWIIYKWESQKKERKNIPRSVHIWCTVSVHIWHERRKIKVDWVVNNTVISKTCILKIPLYLYRCQIIITYSLHIHILYYTVYT